MNYYVYQEPARDIARAYRTHTGPFTTRQQAEAVAARIAQTGYSTWIEAEDD